MAGAAPVTADDRLDILLVLRSRLTSRGLGWVNRAAWLPPAHRTVLDRARFSDGHGASPADIAAVRVSLSSWYLDCHGVDVARRLVFASGPAHRVEEAFRGPAGDIVLPPRMVGIVQAVLGLDTRVELAPLVGPAEPWDRGRILDTIGLSPELHGSGVGVAVTAPAGTEDAAAQQVRVVEQVAPGAKVATYTGPGGEVGAIETLSAAIHDADHAAQVVLAGWGAPESDWSAQAMLAIAQQLLVASAMGVTVVCASPADAATFPATAPHALACGSAEDGTTTSGLFPAPAWQLGMDTAQRVVPDVMGRAEMWAGALALLGEAVGQPLGLVQPLLVDGQLAMASLLVE